LVGVTLTAFAIFEVIVHDLGPVPIVVFAVLPDLSFLAGVGQRHERGQLAPRAVAVYNAAHMLTVPLVVVVLALAALLAIRVTIADPAQFESTRRLPLVAYVAGVMWLGHIAFDRSLGFGPRTPAGWQRD
jgi:Domain of unknown function (DUF4260)